MKAELRARPHSTRPGHLTFEVWYDGKLIGSVYGADGPGIRFISKHPKRYAEMPLALAAELHVDTGRIMPGYPVEAV